MHENAEEDQKYWYGILDRLDGPIDLRIPSEEELDFELAEFDTF